MSKVSIQIKNFAVKEKSVKEQILNFKIKKKKMLRNMILINFLKKSVVICCSGDSHEY